jgi:thioredoxin reductase
MTGESGFEVGVHSTTDPDDLAEVAANWIGRFERLLDERQLCAVDRLFVEDAYWRDLLMMSWDLRSAIGIEDIRAFVNERIINSGFRSFRLCDRQPPRMMDVSPGRRALQVIYNFESDIAKGRALIRLVKTGFAWQALSVLTDMSELRDTPSLRRQWTDAGRPEWTKPIPGRINWADRVCHPRSLNGAEPAVLIIGAGHSGLNLAAQLQRNGVETIVVEKSQRIGDSWRNRYYNLITHSVSFTDHFAFMPYPDSWPLSVEKDQLADWCEAYAQALDLNVVTDSEFLGGNFDESNGRWRVCVRRGSRQRDVLRPKHLVIATGLQGIPAIPDFQGRDIFNGDLLHSSEYRGGRAYIGKAAVVVGSGSSGHDIAQDLVEHGVTDVTMVQRSSTYVMSYEKAVPALLSSIYNPDTALEDSDLMYKSTPYPVALAASKARVSALADLDHDLLERLRATGFQLNDIGMLPLALRPSSRGYYVNQGCSDLIIEGAVKIKHGQVTGFDAEGVMFADGTRLDAAVVVLCTGYMNMREQVRALLGSEVADCCESGPVWVLDERRGGEHNLLWRSSGVQQLWLMAGSLQDARVYSRHLALQIKAMERGILAWDSRSERPALVPHW